MASTSFANTVSGLAALPARLRERIGGRRGLILVDLSQYGSAEPRAVVPEVGPDGAARFPDDDYNFPRIYHPLVYGHPRTGEDLRTLRRVVIHDVYDEIMTFTPKVSDLTVTPAGCGDASIENVGQERVHVLDGPFQCRSVSLRFDIWSDHLQFDLSLVSGGKRGAQPSLDWELSVTGN